MSYAPTPEQQSAIDAFATGENVAIHAAAGSGKTTTLRFIADHAGSKRGLYMAFNRALREDQPVATPLGWKPIGELKVGDLVLGRDGRAHSVTKVHDRGIRPMNAVLFSDGTEVVADDDHLWTIDRTYAGNTRYVKTETIDTARVAELIASGCSVRVPLTDALELGDQDLAIDPYILGVLLGNGSFGYRSTSVSLADDWVVGEIARLLPDGCSIQIHPHSRDRSAPHYGITGRPASAEPGSNPVRNALVQLRLAGTTCNEKSVPRSYLWASAPQRLALLQGLMDTDGCAGASGGITPIYTTTSEQLAKDVAFLAQSLGGAATWRMMREATEKWSPAYQVTVRLPQGVSPFRLPRKKDAVTPRTHDRLLHRRIDSVTSLPAARAVCISIDADDHLFLTAGLVPTHNSVADDARRRFAGTNVASSTVHALAYRDFGAPHRHRLDQKFLFWPQKAARIGAPQRFPVAGTYLTRQTLVRLAEETVKQFCRTMDREITPEIAALPERVRLSPGEELALRETVAGMAQAYWADWMNPDGQIAWLHDTYLKLFALSEPRLDYDYLLVDEAQDLEPLTRGVLALQDTQVIAVGDANQAIYGWRGAEAALDDFGGHRVNLQMSFRFGDAIADEANLWLDALGADIRVQGMPGKDSSVWVSKREPEAVLTRSNGGAISEVLAAQAKGLTVGVAGERKVKELTALAQAALDLQEKGKTSHRELDVFDSWRDAVNYVQEERDDTDLAALVKVIEEYSAPTVLRALQRTVTPDRAQQVISTAHIAKGLEWFHVRIADDFREPGVDKLTGERKPMEAEEARLAYVAVTRAMRHLDPGGLSFIHDGTLTVAGVRSSAAAAAV